MADPSSSPASSGGRAASPLTGRRNILTSIAALVVGAVLSLFPFAAGAMVFLDPVFRKKEEPGGDSQPGKWLRITNVSAVPASGEPVQFPVIDDLVDAWNRQPNQPVGAVYLRRVTATAGSGESGGSEAGGSGTGSEPKVEIEAFNAICPHAGCFVAFSDASQTYKCPCHNSSFNLDGSKIKNTDGTINPAPRPLDKLEVDQQRVESEGEIWVRFVNYLTGRHEQVAK
jgi:Rieske Fe-S protein